MSSYSCSLAVSLYAEFERAFSSFIASLIRLQNFWRLLEWVFLQAGLPSLIPNQRSEITEGLKPNQQSQVMEGGRDNWSYKMCQATNQRPAVYRPDVM